MKLIRDNIPSIALKKGEQMLCHKATEREYHSALREKLLEETHEFLDSGAIDELGDILEVIRAIAHERGCSMRDIYRARDKKRKIRGGFEEKIIWENNSRG